VADREELDSTARSEGLLGRDPATGNTELLIAGGLSARSTAFAFTVEPADGSQQPTTTLLAHLPPTSS
jgi:hypothetical protein